MCAKHSIVGDTLSFDQRIVAVRKCLESFSPEIVRQEVHSGIMCTILKYLAKIKSSELS